MRMATEPISGHDHVRFSTGTNMSLHSAAHLNAIARKLNNRPRQTLNWMKSSEVFSRSVASDRLRTQGVVQTR